MEECSEHLGKQNNLRSDNVGLCSKDIRIFYDSKSRSWIIANDYKLRRLRDQGYGRRTAEKMSHGHLSKRSQCEKVKIGRAHV